MQNSIEQLDLRDKKFSVDREVNLYVQEFWIYIPKVLRTKF